jgi:glucosylceramidase
MRLLMTNLSRTVVLAIALIGATVVNAGELASEGCIQVYTTAKDTALRMTLSDQLQLKPAQQSPETDVAIFLNPDRRYQTFLGIGGAITDASAEVYAGLDRNTQQELMRAYFDTDNGVGYSLLRTTIHSCDFSSGSYTYVEEGDENLSTFDIGRDKEHRIPRRRLARRVAASPRLPVHGVPRRS